MTMMRTSTAAAGMKASSDDAMRKQEALTYLRELKERLKNKKDTYDEFLEIMKEFKGQMCAPTQRNSLSYSSVISLQLSASFER